MRAYDVEKHLSFNNIESLMIIIFGH
jgi:hypothetical protein